MIRRSHVLNYQKFSVLHNLADSVEELNKIIMDRCWSRNEGLPTLLTGNIIAFVTQAFEEMIKTQFSFRVLPVIFPHTTKLKNFTTKQSLRKGRSMMPLALPLA